MKFSNFITVLSILVLALPSFGKKGGPNFIIIIGDDVGWDAFGCTGMKEARTPAIDKLAEESCMMTRFYCSVSQCAASAGRTLHRFAAQEQWRVGKCSKGEAYRGKERRRPLDPLGYKVGLSGKKHFGLGTAKIGVIPGFVSNANGSNQVHSFEGVEEYVSRAKQEGSSFCVIIGATHAHHPWDHGKVKLPLGKSKLATTLC